MFNVHDCKYASSPGCSFGALMILHCTKNFWDQATAATTTSWWWWWEWGGGRRMRLFATNTSSSPMLGRSSCLYERRSYDDDNSDEDYSLPRFLTINQKHVTPLLYPYNWYDRFGQWDSIGSNVMDIRNNQWLNGTNSSAALNETITNIQRNLNGKSTYWREIVTSNNFLFQFELVDVDRFMWEKA